MQIIKRNWKMWLWEEREAVKCERSTTIGQEEKVLAVNNGMGIVKFCSKGEFRVFK